MRPQFLLRRMDDDRGASALLIAGAMVLIMGLAAVVIDGGFGFSERRQAQSGVDFASLGALREAVSCEASGTCSISDAVDNGASEAIDIVEANLPGRNLQAWSDCEDPNRPSEYTQISGPTKCISFTSNLDKIRVKVPDDYLDTTFGAVIGLDTLIVQAEAEAASDIRSSAQIIPHTPTGTSGSEACLFSNQAPQTVPPCDGAASGFYGYLDAALYGDDEELGTPSTCNNGDTNLRVAINLAKGGDHSMVEYSFGSPADAVVNDHAACPNTNEDVNEVRVETGSPTGGITDGLIDGVSGSINGEAFTSSPGRIICNPVANPDGYSTECASIRGVSLDHTGLWEFLDSGCPGTDTHAEMKNCLETGSPTFLASLADHPRFAAVPILFPNPPDTEAPTGPGDYKIEKFQAVWIETLYFDCNASKCDTVHSPGEDHTPPGPPPGDPGSCPNPLDTIRNCGWTDTSGPDTVEGMVAFLIDQSMLPAEITDTFPGAKTERSYALIE